MCGKMSDIIVNANVHIKCVSEFELIEVWNWKNYPLYLSMERLFYVFLVNVF